MLVRFVEYSFKNDEDDYADPNFISAIEINETYDRFISALEFMIKNERHADIKGNTYLIDDYRLSYSGDDDSRTSINVYLLEDYDTVYKYLEH